MKDKIEGLPEITRVDEVGALDREIQVNVDMYKMQAAQFTMGDIERAVAPKTWWYRAVQLRWETNNVHSQFRGSLLTWTRCVTWCCALWAELPCT